MQEGLFSVVGSGAGRGASHMLHELEWLVANAGSWPGRPGACGPIGDTAYVATESDGPIECFPLDASWRVYLAGQG